MTVKINIKGAIIGNDFKEVYDFYEMESTCPNDILNALPNNNEPIKAIINSGGGHIDAGSEIYYLLKDYSGEVTIKIVGMAASAASVIAMAGDKVIMAPTAQLMIHNVSIIAQGDYNEMLHKAGVLQEMNKSVANAYILKTGKSEAEILELMNKETYFSPKKAMQHGFIDEIMGVSAEKLSSYLVASTTNPDMLPMSVIEKYRDMKVEKKNRPQKHTNKIAKLFTTL